MPVARLLLFVASYCPLFVILAVRFQAWPLRAACAGLATLGICSLVALLKLDRRSSLGSHKLRVINDASSPAASYLASYLLPFVVLPEPTWADLVGYTLFLAVAAVIHCRSSIIQVNPLLFVLGYHVLTIEDTNGFKAYLIARQKPVIGDTVLVTRFANDVLIFRRMASQTAEAV